MRNVRALDDALLVEVCWRFLDQGSPSEIAEWLNTRIEGTVSREEIYPLIREAIRRKYLALHPPVNEVMSQRIADRFRGGEDKDRIHVVSVEAESAPHLVPPYAAKLLAEKIRSVGSIRKRVRIGLGGGETIMRVSQELAAQLRDEEELPNLGLHVLSSGFAVKRPRTAPITFLGYFGQVPTDIDYVGLFAPAVVDTGNYDAAIALPGVEESFRSAKYIDIVTTSLASADDPHGELNEFMALSGEKTYKDLTALQKDGWVGDLQYHPYGSDGPITDVNLSVRAVSLFDLAALKKLAARENKHVIVVAAPCRACGRTKCDAIRPLLESKNMKVWTDLIMDMTTAQELLAGPS